jgi:threonine/homoserine/homoserine lactone efflux protein
MTIEPWQVSIIVTAGIVLAELGVHAVLRNVSGGAWHKRVRTVALVLLVGLTLVVAVAALGPTMADKLASVASAVAAVAAAWLAYLSYQASRSGDLSGTGAPPKDEPATPEPIPGDDEARDVTEQDAVAG